MNESNNIVLNSWVRILVGVIVSVIFGIATYSYAIVLPKLADNVILNDKDSRERDNRIVDRINMQEVKLAELSSIREDVKEIKNLLKEKIR